MRDGPLEKPIETSSPDMAPPPPPPAATGATPPSRRRTKTILDMEPCEYDEFDEEEYKVSVHALT